MIVPHAFQQDVFNRVRAARVGGARKIVVQGTTGVGKTVIGGMFVKSSFDLGKRCLWMVHRRKLVDQASERFEAFGIKHAKLMRGEHVNLGASVQVASRDTLISRHFDEGWIDLPPADLVCVDEAHHCGPESQYRKILEQYPKATVLLLTATPVLPDGSGLGPWAQAMVCCPPTSQLVKEGYLMPVRCYAPNRKKKGRKFIRGICGDLVESWKAYAENRPTVLFCGRVSHSLEAVEAFRAAGITAEHVDADTPDDERERIFDRVRSGETKVLSNVGIIGEGVDIPELSCCQLFCNLPGRVRFLQCVGRVMRTMAGKAYGILIDHSGAVFQHGFPDEDTEFSLEGNTDEDFRQKQKDGKTEKAFYCKACEIVWHGDEHCPQCGRKPQKPPASIFAAPPVESTNEVLIEAERGPKDDSQERLKTWFACLAVAVKRNGSFGMASQIYRNKYKTWPPENFPMNCRNKTAKVSDVYPDYGRKKVH